MGKVPASHLFLCSYGDCLVLNAVTSPDKPPFLSFTCSSGKCQLSRWLWHLRKDIKMPYLYWVQFLPKAHAWSQMWPSLLRVYSSSLPHSKLYCHSNRWAWTETCHHIFTRCLTASNVLFKGMDYYSLYSLVWVVHVNQEPEPMSNSSKLTDSKAGEIIVLK